MRRRLSNALSTLRTIGPLRFARYAVYHLATSPGLWERFLVRRLSGGALASLVADLPGFTSNATVSVVLPVNNGRSKGVERLVASLRAQTHDRLELIAVDSGSTDDTVSWLRGQGFKVIEIAPESFTHALSRNTGAEAASGDYLLFVVDDAVFTDPDWLRSALFLLERTGADAMSSRQSIDGQADAYARLLDHFLASAQSRTPSVNISRSGFMARQLRRRLPLRTIIRSVSIDDTNHLVRKSSFDSLRFRTPTVEDIDFARRLTASGGTTLYTNLLSVLHYHRFAEQGLGGYARRVFLDTKVIGAWQPLKLRFRTREAVLLAAFHALAVMLQALDEQQRSTDSGVWLDPARGQITRLQQRDSVTELLELARSIEARSAFPLASGHMASTRSATAIFSRILGADPPSGLFFDVATFRFYMRQTRHDIDAALRILSGAGASLDDAPERRTVCLFLWCNRLMSLLARPEIFASTTLPYAVDEWSITDWK